MKKRSTLLILLITSIVFITIFSLTILLRLSNNLTSATLTLLNDNSTVQLSNNRNNTLINLEVARSEVKQETGLMYKKEIKQNQGMIFIFSKPSIQKFWMKDTPTSLDMIFLDQNLNIVQYYQNTIPDSQLPIYSSIGNAQYVIELKAGWIHDNLINKSDHFNIHMIN